MKIHRTAAFTVASLLALTTSGLAVAQESVPVTTALATGTRVLEVTDLAGQDLTGIALVPGRASAFRVAVRDTAATSVDPNFVLQGYDVESSLTNLYATSDGGVTYDYGTSIPSSEVTLGKAASPLDVKDALVHLDPEYVLSSGAIDCQAIADALGLLVADLLDSATCLLLGTLTGGALTISDVALTGTPYEDIDLSGLTDAQLPLVPNGVPDAGNVYTNPDCVNGVAVNDTACPSTTSGTPLTMLAATPATTFSAQLLAILDPFIPATLADADGTNAKASLQDVLTAMHDSGVQEVSDFATQIVADFTAAQQLDIINTLMTAAAGTLAANDLGGLGLLASGFPTLKVDPTATAGTYGGTLTVTLVECPECP